jgi:hypothetical protein
MVTGEQAQKPQTPHLSHPGRMSQDPERQSPKMNGMANHARKAWTGAEMILGTAVMLLGFAIAVLGFLDIYLSITHLLHPIWGDWSWTVIVLGEGSFAGCYLGWLLLVLRDRLPARVRVFLVAYLAVFASGSLVLMTYAGRGSLPGIASHVIVVAAFYGFLLFVKVLIHRLSADPAERAFEEELADARQHAIDLVRDRCGIFWRFTAPRLLRRQITSGRFPHAVMAAVRDSLKEYGQSWEPAVGTWIADGLAVRVKAETRAETVHQDITRKAAEALARQAPPAAVGAPPAEPIQDAPQDSPRTASADTSPKPLAGAVQRARRKGGRKVTDDEVREAIRELYADGKPVTKYRVMKELPVGDDRAGRLLAEVQDERPPLAVAR